jgi:hypothetical protein
MGVFVALMFDEHVETARFQSVKLKASSTPFLYIGSLPLSLYPLGFGILASFQLQASMLEWFVERCKDNDK